MAKKYTSHGNFKVEDAQLYTVFGRTDRKKQIISQKSWLAILEIFIHQHSLESAYQIYQGLNFQINDLLLVEIDKCRRILETSDDFVISLEPQKLIVYPNGLKDIINLGTKIDLSQVSRETYQVLHHLLEQQQLEDDLDAITSFSTFTNVVELMDEIGLLSPAIGTIDWGDFRKKVPICHVVGFTRGVPIDRYYLGKFVTEIQEQVVGKVLEIGGAPGYHEFYNFSELPEYRLLDLEAGPSVDIVGDVHDPSVVEPESMDSIVIFNVLEHCYAPGDVVQNIHRWLKVGGKCFCLVPNAQRLHKAPADYWRPLPDGIAFLFKNFAKQKLYVYGNPMSVVASFFGIAVEEMVTEDLDAFHPNYPVITCIVAEK